MFRFLKFSNDSEILKHKKKKQHIMINEAKIQNIIDNILMHLHLKNN